jgi:hypothetical protein
VSNRQIYLILAAIILAVAIVAIVTASPDEHPIKFGP